MERLNRINQDPGDLVRSPADQADRCRMKVLEREAVGDGSLTSQAGLYAIPPAVVSARKADNQLPARIESRQAYCGHHGLSTAHMKRYFVQFRNGFNQLNIF